MSITTYDELVTSVIKWSHNRNDIIYMIPEFINLTEIDFYNNSAHTLKVRQLTTTTTLVTIANNNRIALPLGFESMRLIRISDGLKTALDYKSPEEMVRQLSTGRPTQFSIVGNFIEFNRIPDSIYNIDMQYIQKAPSLTKINQTNDILTNYPNLYLYGVLAQLYTFTEEQELMVKWFMRFTDSIKGANKAWKQGKYGTAPTVNIRGFTP